MNRDMGMIDLLLKYGARDEDCKALAVAAKSTSGSGKVQQDEVIMSKLLALKANQDPENGVNKKGIADLHQSSGSSGPIGFASVGSLAYSSIFPSTSVMVNWHQQGCLTHLKDQWLIDAAVRLNPKLRLSPKCQQVSLHAITRLDFQTTT
jgi:hypothetical protein